MKTMNKIGHQMAIKDGDWRTLGIESPPIRPRQVDEILQQLPLLSGFSPLVIHAEELKMRGPREGLCDIRLIRIDTFKPDQIFVRAKPHLCSLIGDEAVHGAVDSEESTLMIHLNH
jgi:hypothetical protein